MPPHQSEASEFTQLLIGQKVLESQLSEIIRRLNNLEKGETAVSEDLTVHRKEVDKKIEEIQKWQYIMMGGLSILSFLSPLFIKKLGF